MVERLEKEEQRDGWSQSVIAGKQIKQASGQTDRQDESGGESKGTKGYR